MIKKRRIRLLDKILIPWEWGNKYPKMNFFSFLTIRTLDFDGFCLKVDQYQYQYILIVNKNQYIYNCFDSLSYSQKYSLKKSYKTSIN